MPKSVQTNEYDQFRSLLREARKGAGLSQMELAKKLGEPQSVVSKVERGERRLDVVEFLDFVEAIGADPIQVLTLLLENRRKR